MDTTSIFAKRLSKLREEKGISQQVLADALGVTRQSLSVYEKAERTINTELLVRIANYFKVSADYLLGLSDVATLDADIQVVGKYTGLSETAIGVISSFKDLYVVLYSSYDKRLEYYNLMCEKFINDTNEIREIYERVKKEHGKHNDTEE